MQNENYEKFFELIKEFLAKEDERKKRENDYNPLLVIRSVSDEVRLHSRMLHSLLNPLGKHYQGSLFLEPFLEKLNFNIDTSKARIWTEYNHIDLYISDGDKHIIIENKIYADDGDKQIEKYIQKILDEGVECENINVVYLSIDEKEPKPESLGKWKINGKVLKKDGKEIRYKNITYKKDILEWIENCQAKVKNITNLYASFEFYKKCVEQITQGEQMSLEQFLKEKPEFIDIAAKIQGMNLEEISIELLKQEVADKPEFKGWKIFDESEIKSDRTSGYKRLFAFGNEKHLNQCFKFMLALEKTRFNNKYIGFALFIKNEYGSKVYNHFCGFKDDKLPQRLKMVIEKKKKEFKLNFWGWWLLDENGRYDVDLTSESLKDYFIKLYKKVDELNDFLGEEERRNDNEIARLASEVKGV